MPNLTNILATYQTVANADSVFWFGFFLASIVIAIPLFLGLSRGVIQTKLFAYIQGFGEQVLNILNTNAKNRRNIQEFLDDAKATRDTLNAFNSRYARRDSIVHAVKSIPGYEIDKVVAEIQVLGREMSETTDAIKYNFFSAISEINRGTATQEVYDYLNSKPKQVKVEVDYSANNGNGKYTNAQSAQYTTANKAQAPENENTIFITLEEYERSGFAGMIFTADSQFMVRFRDGKEVQMTGEAINNLQNKQGKKIKVDFVVLGRVA